MLFVGVEICMWFILVVMCFLDFDDFVDDFVGVFCVGEFVDVE